MKFIIDTSSLVSLAKYYMAHDGDSIIHSFIKKKLEQGEIIIVDKVLEECEYFQQGLVLKSLDYLADANYLKKAGFIYRTNELLASFFIALLFT